MGYKNILIPLDGSELAEKALKHVVPIAEPGATLHILSLVIDDNSILTSMALSGTYGGFVAEKMPTSPSIPHLISEREHYLSEVTRPLQEKGYKVIIDARRGEVVQSIIELARDGYDAILMATHGRTGLSKALLGSVAQSVVVKSPCPVILIPAHSVDEPSTSP